MKNPNIGKVLRYYRQAHHYTVNDVSVMLNDKNLTAAPKTIYAWENGRTQPDADTLLILCEIYKIDNILESFGYSNEGKEEFPLTDFERSLLLAYRMHPEMHSAVHKLLGISDPDDTATL